MYGILTVLADEYVIMKICFKHMYFADRQNDQISQYPLLVYCRKCFSSSWKKILSQLVETISCLRHLARNHFKKTAFVIGSAEQR